MVFWIHAIIQEGYPLIALSVPYSMFWEYISNLSVTYRVYKVVHYWICILNQEHDVMTIVRKIAVSTGSWLLLSQQLSFSSPYYQISWWLVCLCMCMCFLDIIPSIPFSLKDDWCIHFSYVNIIWWLIDWLPSYFFENCIPFIFKQDYLGPITGFFIIQLCIISYKMFLWSSVIGLRKVSS